MIDISSGRRFKLVFFCSFKEVEVNLCISSVYNFFSNGRIILRMLYSFGLEGFGVFRGGGKRDSVFRIFFSGCTVGLFLVGG